MPVYASYAESKTVVVCDPNFLPFFQNITKPKTTPSPPPPSPRQTEAICLHWLQHIPGQPSPQCSALALGAGHPVEALLGLAEVEEEGLAGGGLLLLETQKQTGVHIHLEA